MPSFILICFYDGKGEIFFILVLLLFIIFAMHWFADYIDFA